jgi:rhomboid family GlyGly-CTERM serine protease
MTPGSSLLQRWNFGGLRGVTAALLGFALPALAALGDAPRLALRYERGPIAAGEWWRLATGHLVHLDLRHALLNVAGLLLVWALFAGAFRAWQWGVILLAALASIDAGLWLLNPGLQWYVGASGLLHGAMAAGIVQQMIQRDRLAWVLGVVGAGKLLYEHFSGALPLAGDAGVVITDAHLYGAVAGAICGALFRPASAPGGNAA